jgi:hypothetical protein
MIKLIVNKHTNTEVELTKVDNEIVMSVSTDVLVEDEWGPETNDAGYYTRNTIVHKYDWTNDGLD